MPESISVAEFIEHTWDDYKSPKNSTFDKKLSKCRTTVSQIEEELDIDRSELTKLKKSVRALYNTTNKHAQNEKDIAENLERIGNSTLEKTNSTASQGEINNALQVFSRVTRNLGKLLEDLSKSLHNSLQFPLENFLKGDIKDVKCDLRKPLDKSWKDYESKFSKLEKDCKKKSSEAGPFMNELPCSDVAEEMEKERKIFQLQMCMYLIKVNEIKTKKGVDLLGYLIEYFNAVKLFFNKGQTEIEKHQPVIEKLGYKLKDIKQTQNNERAKLSELQTALKSSLTGYKEPSSTAASPPGYSLHQLQGNKNHGSVKEGYLLKKSEGMLKKIWQKRKCRIKDGIMSISHSDETKNPVKLNLLTCQVKLVSDDPGKKCFDLVSSHGNRTYHFQADDEKEMEQWISVLSNAKEEVLLKAFQDSSSSVTISESVRELTRNIIDRISNLPGNKTCCDCGAPAPKWLSTNLGVLICLECCGIHRNLGVHVSRTQSLEIDQLGTSQLLLARAIGNDNFNEVLEARLGDESQKPKPNSPMTEREEFIKAKYLHHKFTIQTCSDMSELQQDLQQAIQTRDIQAVLQVYAEGLDLMTVLPDTPLNDTALHLAIVQDDGASLHVVDFIVQNSNLNSLSRQNRDGNTCLHLCAMLNKSECMKCLLRTKPDTAFIPNNLGQTALDIAVQNNYQLCAELLKAAMAGKKDVFENINIEWDLVTDEDAGYSDEDIANERPRSRPASIIGGENPLQSSSPRERPESDGIFRQPKPRKHHLTHPTATHVTRFRNSYQSTPTISGQNHTPSQSSCPTSPAYPPVPPRGVKKPPGALGAMAPVIATHHRNVSIPETDIPYILHRRSPSEPPMRPQVNDSGNTTQFLFKSSLSSSQTVLDQSSIKPAVPPKPRIVANSDCKITDGSSNKTTELPETPPPIPAPRKLKKLGLKRCEALFDCDADNEDELTFREGEVILLLREEEEEWWEGEIENQPHRKGLFPLRFVKQLPD